MSAMDENAGMLQDMGIQVIQELARLNAEIAKRDARIRQLERELKQEGEAKTYRGQAE